MSVNKKRIRVIIIVALLIIAVGIIARNVLHKDPVTVTAKAVEAGLVESIVANTRAGTVNACRRAKLAPPTGGKLERQPVKKGDRVKAGQVLLELWNRDLVAQVQLAETDIATARSKYEETCLMAQSSEREAGRLQELQKKGLTSEENVDKGVTSSKAQQAACRAAKSSIESGEARLAAARAALERTILKAPFDGYIAELNGEVGEYVTPSPPGIPTPPAVDLVDVSCLYITAPIDEVDAPRIRTGMPARITLDAFPGKSFKGTVRRIAPYVLEAEKQARTVDIEAVFADPSEYKDLLPGYSADVEVVLDARDNVLRIPTEAVLEGKHVLVLREGVLEDRVIETGLSNWKFTEVKKGLSAGEQVVTSVGREGVKAGAVARGQ